MGNYDSSMMNSIFRSLPNTGNNLNGLNSIYSNLGELSNIQSGNYLKAAKKFYAAQAESDDTKKTDTKKYTPKDYFNETIKNKSSIATSKDSEKALALTDESSEKLGNSAKALVNKTSSSLFTKKGGEYDVNKIYDAVKSFVSDYNDVIDNVKGSSATSITSAAEKLTNKTNLNAKSLSEIGITVDKDTNKLTLDEKTFKAADMEDVKKLFNGNGSYGYQTEVNANMIQSAAEREASKANTYNDLGTYAYNNNAGNIYTGWF